MKSRYMLVDFKALFDIRKTATKSNLFYKI